MVVFLRVLWGVLLFQHTSSDLSNRPEVKRIVKGERQLRFYCGLTLMKIKNNVKGMNGRLENLLWLTKALGFGHCSVFWYLCI